MLDMQKYMFFFLFLSSDSKDLTNITVCGGVKCGLRIFCFFFFYTDVHIFTSNITPLARCEVSQLMTVL